MVFDADRAGEARETDSARLRRAYVLGAIGKKLRKINAIASGEYVCADPNAKDRTSSPRQRHPHVVDRPEHFVALRDVDTVDSDQLPPDKTGFRRSVEICGRAESQRPISSHRQDPRDEREARGGRLRLIRP